MKSLITIAILAIGLMASAQKNALPEAVQKTFEEKYPMATDVKTKAKKDEIRIRFENEGNATMAVFTADGEWQSTQTTLKHKNTPEKVAATLEKKYADGSYSSVLFVEKKSGDMYYKVSVDMPKAIFNLELNEKGVITKTEKVDKPKPSSNTGGDE